MATIFDGVQAANPQRSTFDLTHDRKYTMQGGYLTPILVKETVPGDKFSISASSIVRLIPMVGPVMHRIDMDIHFFYVPNRLLWKNWEKFITGSKLAGADAGVVPTHPYVDMIEQSVSDQSFSAVGSLCDYLGYPVTDNGIDPSTHNPTKKLKCNSLPLRAYYLIWKEYYRDQNVMSADEDWDTIYETDGDEYSNIDEITYYGVELKRCWEKDYFTSALPWVQKGDPLTIPLGSTANLFKTIPMGADFKNADVTNISSDVSVKKEPTNTAPGETTDIFAQTGERLTLNVDNMKVDLTGATAATINDLRAAFQAQIWLERNARAGTRYIESLEAHFGVRPADYRLQRPELFGASRMPIQISEVLQTSESGTTEQGNMAGHGIGYDKASFSTFCPEHGWIIGIASIKPRTSYMYAVHKQIFRLDYLDYYWPEFARLGEQAVLRKELGFNADDVDDTLLDKLEETFAYQSRYAEYRSALSTVHGGMRNDVILKNWHMARANVDYSSNMNPVFLQADPTTRIFADTEASIHYIVHTFFKIYAKRPMPFFANPGYIDHP